MRNMNKIVLALLSLFVPLAANAKPFRDYNYHLSPPLDPSNSNREDLTKTTVATIPQQNECCSKIVISQKDYNFETNFDVDSEHGHLGYISQSSFSLRKNYTFYDRDGLVSASAYSRLLSFGTIRQAATVMDVYDGEGKQVGLIEGTLIFTTAPAKFYFYDSKNKVVGIAYMDKNRSSFTVYDPVNDKRIIASYNRIFERDVLDHWEIEVIDTKSIDLKVLVSFGAFAIDTQEQFREDN